MLPKTRKNYFKNIRKLKQNNYLFNSIEIELIPKKNEENRVIKTIFMRCAMFTVEWRTLAASRTTKTALFGVSCYTRILWWKTTNFPHKIKFKTI